MIAKRGDKYVILSSKGKQLGEYATKKEATKRLKQIEYFKMKAKKKYVSGGVVNNDNEPKKGKKKNKTVVQRTNDPRDRIVKDINPYGSRKFIGREPGTSVTSLNPKSASIPLSEGSAKLAPVNNPKPKPTALPSKTDAPLFADRLFSTAGSASNKAEMRAIRKEIKSLNEKIRMEKNPKKEIKRQQRSKNRKEIKAAYLDLAAQRLKNAAKNIRNK